MVYQLDSNIWFPDPELADEDGCLAVGGDLSPERLLLAYSYGIFPWFSFRTSPDPIWYCPHERFVIFPDEIHVSHSMRTLLHKNKYVFSIDRDFEGVIRACSRLRINEEGAWLGEDMIHAYTELHHRHAAHSVEVWERPEPGQTAVRRLVGGLYGVNIGKVFIGESMFSLVPSGSKLALIYLAKTLPTLGGKLIDCQLETPHLKSMGGRFISYAEYMSILDEGCS